MKTISFKMPKPATAEQWVQGARPQDREAQPIESMKRFTIDVPADLHSRIKMECARRGDKMADVIRELLDREFPKN